MHVQRLAPVAPAIRRLVKRFTQRMHIIHGSCTVFVSRSHQVEWACYKAVFISMQFFLCKSSQRTTFLPTTSESLTVTSEYSYHGRKLGGSG